MESVPGELTGDAATGPGRPGQRARPAPAIRDVALPREHGGWSLTLEPVLLGLLVAWSGAGLALGAAGLLAFVARTPLKVVLVDRWRHRWLARTTLAARVAAIELAVLVVLAILATVAAGAAGGRFWVPLAVAAPLIAIELWFDMRSRSRRLVPELAGAVGIGSLAAAIALAGGTEAGLAAGLWCVVAARSAAAIPFVRTQIARLHGRPSRRWQSDLAQGLGVAVPAAGWALDAVPPAAVAAVAVVGAANLVDSRRPPRPVIVLGVQQTLYGLAVVAVTAAAVSFG